MSDRVPTFDAVAAPLPARSLALEASAGTGKTWTLTALTVRYVAEEGLELPELLVVTFTRAATAELRTRVRTRLGEALTAVESALDGRPTTSADADPLIAHLLGGARAAADPGAELALRGARLRRALGQLDEATIATIHGFCQSMLQHAALEVGVDLDASLLEDDRDLLGEVVDDHLARELRPADPDWIRYLHAAGGVDRDRLVTLADEVAALPELRLRPTLDVSDTPDLAPWTGALEELRQVWDAGGGQQLVALVEQLGTHGAWGSRQQTFTVTKAAAQAEAVQAWLRADHPVPPAPPQPSAKLHLLRDHPYAWFSSASLSTRLLDPASVAGEPLVVAADRLLAATRTPATRFLLRTAHAVRSELERRKLDGTVLTFDDLLRRLDRALSDPDARAQVRRAIRQRFRVALIDEFQDTDPVQWRIFSTLFGPGDPLVLIGDPKQAIYGFRGADIHTYVRARDTRGERSTLARNFRSDARYVDACNHLFGQPGAFATADIPYHPVGAARRDRLGDPRGRAPLQVRFLRRELGGTDGLTKGLLGKTWLEDHLVADVAVVAAGLLTDGITIADDDPAEHPPRALAPRDLAVLVRTNARARAVQRALVAAGVPAVIQRGGSVFDTDEAQAVDRLLAAMLRPGSVTAAVAAAASVLGGRDAAWLATQLAGGADADVDPAGPAAWERWLDDLSRWGVTWARSGVLAGLQQCIGEDGVTGWLLGREDGERRVTNLRHLMELLHAAETAGGLAPNALLEWLRAQRAEAADGPPRRSEAELRLEADTEAVRVVTIHGAKGLQYPVVLCPDLWESKNPGRSGPLRFHDPGQDDPAAAITLDVDTDPTSPSRLDTVGLVEAASRTEQLRLAYVALTRAEHRSIVWWGAITSAATSPLASLLHGGRAEGDDRLEQAAGRVGSADDDLLVEDLQRLSTASTGAIGVEQVTGLTGGARWRPPARTVPRLAARPWTRGPLDTTWRRSSFTSLVRGADPTAGAAPDVPAVSEDRARDVDAVEPTVPAGVTPSGAPGSGGPEVPLGRFPRGPGPGTYLHDVLEHLDFRRVDEPGHVDRIVEGHAARHGLEGSPLAGVAEGIRLAVGTELGPSLTGVRLTDLARRDRYDELRFELPLVPDGATGALAVGDLATLLAGSADPLVRSYATALDDPALAVPVRGYLNGSIDLLARLPDGRVLVADYKSNWLGDPDTGRSVATDYDAQALHRSMLEHHYVLQGLLYLVAAHRFLRWRLDGYRPGDHLAGAAYLFLRGMVGGPDGRTGVVHLQPEPDLVVELSRRMEEGTR